MSEKHFTCDYFEWRIKWAFDQGHYHFFPRYHTFSVATYREGEDTNPVNSIFEMANGSRSGTSYIHDSHGQHYMAIRALDLDSYTIIIKQNTDAIPEFPSWAILPLLLAATAAAVTLRKHLSRSPRNSAA